MADKNGVGDLRPRNDMILAAPVSDDNRVYVPNTETSQPTVKATVLAVGPWVNPPEDPEAYGADPTVNNQGIEDRIQRNKKNKIQIGDTVYFSPDRAFLLETRPMKIYAVSDEDIVASIIFEV